MARHRTHSIEFKRQVAQEYLCGEALHGLAKRHDVQRQLIRVWVRKYEEGALDWSNPSRNFENFCPHVDLAFCRSMLVYRRDKKVAMTAHNLTGSRLGESIVRYLMMIMGNADYEAGKQPSQELQQAMGEYIGRTASEGVFIDGAGLLPSSKGFTARSRNGQINFTDGPFAEAREIIGGYAIVELPNTEAAKALVKDFINVHITAGVLNVDCEIRPLEPM